MHVLPGSVSRADERPAPTDPDSFNFKGALDGVWRAMVAQRWVVVAAVFLSTTLVAGYVWIWPPVYQAEVVIAADSDQDVQRAAFYQGWNTFRRDGLTDESTLMTSAPVLREVVEQLNLKYEDVYHPFLNYAVHLWSTSWIGKRYRAAKVWLLGIERNPKGLTPEQIERYKLLSDFEKGVAVKQVGQANIGLLIVKGSNQRVAEIANAVAEVYLRQRRERFIAEARQAHESLSKEAERTLQELQVFDEQVKRFRAESGAVLLFEKDRAQIGHWLALRSAITDLEAVTAENEASLNVISQQIASEGSKLRSDRMFVQDVFKDRLPKLEGALAAARQSFQPDSREVRDLEEQIRVARAGIEEGGGSVIVRPSARISDSYETLLVKKQALESSLSGNRAALKIKRAEYERIRNLLEQIPEKQQLNREFERRQQMLENKYSGIGEKLTVAAVSMASAESAPAALRIVDRASIPEQPAWPQAKLLLSAAALAGLVFGVLAAVLIEVSLERAHRARFAGRPGRPLLFAAVEQDKAFLQRIYPGFRSEG